MIFHIIMDNFSFFLFPHCENEFSHGEIIFYKSLEGKVTIIEIIHKYFRKF